VNSSQEHCKHSKITPYSSIQTSNLFNKKIGILNSLRSLNTIRTEEQVRKEEIQALTWTSHRDSFKASIMTMTMRKVVIILELPMKRFIKTTMTYNTSKGC
jgi:hypothetical protein